MNLWNHQYARDLPFLKWILDSERRNLAALVSKVPMQTSRILDLLSGLGSTLDLLPRAEYLMTIDKSLSKLQKGVSAAMTGPGYETAAEVRILESFGAGCMSTVLEVIMARQLGLRIAGFSCIINLGKDLSKTPLSHEEVKETASWIETDFIRFVRGVIHKITHNHI